MERYKNNKTAFLIQWEKKIVDRDYVYPACNYFI